MKTTPSSAGYTISALTRRTFVRKSAFATGAATLAGLINARGEESGDETTYETTVETSVSSTCCWELIWQKRTFPGTPLSGNGYSTEALARLACNAALWQQIAASTFVDEDYDCTTGLTHQDPPYIEFGGFQVVPAVYYNSATGKWDYSVNIPAGDVMLYFWR